MGSFRVGIGFKECPKCEFKECIIDVWDRDYDGIKETYYCPVCNQERAELFLREYIYGKLWSGVSRAARGVVPDHEKEVADAILEILKFDDDGGYGGNELLKRIAGLKEFRLGIVFDFGRVREMVREGLDDK